MGCEVKEANRMIEQVIIKRTLKAGKKVWLEGSIENSPLPDILIQEAELETGTVEVLKGSNKNDQAKTIYVTKRVDERKDTTTNTSIKTVAFKNKGRPKLRRRK